MTAILFVCLGNICRSPAAEGVLRHMAEKGNVDLSIESCGLGSWHEGQLPDERMRETTKKRGVVLSSRAQVFSPKHLDKFDYILAADNSVLNELYRHATSPDQKSKIHLITHYSSVYRDQEIPDPYYHGEAGFEHVLDMIEDSCEGLLNYLKNS